MRKYIQAMRKYGEHYPNTTVSELATIIKISAKFQEELSRV